MRGNGRIFPRKGTASLWCAYYLRGKEYRESTGTPDPKQAEKFLKRRLKEVGADQIGAKPFMGPQQERLTCNQRLPSFLPKLSVFCPCFSLDGGRWHGMTRSGDVQDFRCMRSKAETFSP
jgi:hypothetical protein